MSLCLYVVNLKYYFVVPSSIQALRVLKPENYCLA